MCLLKLHTQGKNCNWAASDAMTNRSCSSTQTLNAEFMKGDVGEFIDCPLEKADEGQEALWEIMES